VDIPSCSHFMVIIVTVNASKDKEVSQLVQTRKWCMLSKEKSAFHLTTSVKPST
jgi:hypothetical protein